MGVWVALLLTACSLNPDFFIVAEELRGSGGLERRVFNVIQHRFACVSVLVRFPSASASTNRFLFESSFLVSIFISPYLHPLPL